MTESYTIEEYILAWIKNNFDAETISSWSDEEFTHYANQAIDEADKRFKQFLFEGTTEFYEEFPAPKPYVSYQETDYDNLYSY